MEYSGYNSYTTDCYGMDWKHSIASNSKPYPATLQDQFYEAGRTGAMGYNHNTKKLTFFMSNKQPVSITFIERK